MSNIIFPGKFIPELRMLVFPFLADIQTGITISSATVEVLDSTGTDLNPTSMKVGAVIISGTNVKQLISGGVLGIIYTVNCTATLSDGQVAFRRGSIAIIPAG